MQLLPQHHCSLVYYVFKSIRSSIMHPLFLNASKSLHWLYLEIVFTTTEYGTFLLHIHIYFAYFFFFHSNCNVDRRFVKRSAHLISFYESFVNFFVLLTFRIWLIYAFGNIFTITCKLPGNIYLEYTKLSTLLRLWYLKSQYIYLETGILN